VKIHLLSLMLGAGSALGEWTQTDSDNLASVEQWVEYNQTTLASIDTQLTGLSADVEGALDALGAISSSLGGSIGADVAAIRAKMESENLGGDLQQIAGILYEIAAILAALVEEMTGQGSSQEAMLAKLDEVISKLTAIDEKLGIEGEAPSTPGTLADNSGYLSVESSRVEEAASRLIELRSGIDANTTTSGFTSKSTELKGTFDALSASVGTESMTLGSFTLPGVGGNIDLSFSDEQGWLGGLRSMIAWALRLGFVFGVGRLMSRHV